MSSSLLLSGKQAELEWHKANCFSTWIAVRAFHAKIVFFGAMYPMGGHNNYVSEAKITAYNGNIIGSTSFHWQKTMLPNQNYAPITWLTQEKLNEKARQHMQFSGVPWIMPALQTLGSIWSPFQVPGETDDTSNRGWTGMTSLQYVCTPLSKLSPLLSISAGRFLAKLLFTSCCHHTARLSSSVL